MIDDSLQLTKSIGSSVVANNYWSKGATSNDLFYISGCCITKLNDVLSSKSQIVLDKAVSCINVSNNGEYIAVGERGRDPKCIIYQIQSSSFAHIATLKGGHKHGIGCVCISADNKFIVTVGFKYDKCIAIWDFNTQQQICSHKLSNKVHSISFHVSGEYFITCGDRHLKYWYLTTPDKGTEPSDNNTDQNIPITEVVGKPASILEDHRHSVFVSGCFGHVKGHTDSYFCVTAQGVLCEFLNTRAVQHYVQLNETQPLTSYCLTWIEVPPGPSSIGTSGILGVGCSNGEVYLVSVDTFVVMVKVSLESLSLTGTIKSLNQVSTTPTASSVDCANKIYPACYAIAFLPSRFETSKSKTGNSSHGTLVCSYADKSIIEWELNIKDLLKHLKSQTSSSSSVSPARQIATANPFISMSRHHEAHHSCIWDIHFLFNYSTLINNGLAVANDDSNLKTSAPIGAHFPTGSFVTCSSDNTIRFWTCASGLVGEAQNDANFDLSKGYTQTSIIPMFSESSSQVTLAGSTASSAPNTGSGFGYTSTFKPELITSSLAASSGFMNTMMTNMDFSSLAAGGGGGGGDPSSVFSLSYSFPDTESPTHVQDNSSPRTLAQHPLIPHLVCGCRDGVLHIYDMTNMAVLKSTPAHSAEILTLHFSPALSYSSHSSSDATVGNWTVDPEPSASSLVLLASAGRDRLIHIYDAGTAHPDYSLITTLDKHTSSVTVLRFSSDGQKLISCGGDHTMIYYAVNGPEIKFVKSVQTSHSTISGLSIETTNKFAVTCGQDKRLNVWNIQTGKLMRTYKNEASAELYKADIDPSGMFVAVCGFDKMIRIFDFFSGDQVGQGPGHSELITAVKFSPDGQTLISIGGDGCILVWRLPDEIVDAIKDRLIELYSQARRKQIKVIQKIKNTMNSHEPAILESSASYAPQLQHQQYQNMKTPVVATESAHATISNKPLAAKSKPAVPIQKKPVRPTTASSSSSSSSSSSNNNNAGVASLAVVGTNVNKKSSSAPRVSSNSVPSYMAPKGAKLVTKPPAPSSVFGFGNQKASQQQQSQPPPKANKWQQKPPLAMFDSTKSYSLFGRKISPGQMTPSELNKFTLELTMEEIDLLSGQGFSVDRAPISEDEDAEKEEYSNDFDNEQGNQGDDEDIDALLDRIGDGEEDDDINSYLRSSLANKNDNDDEMKLETISNDEVDDSGDEDSLGGEHLFKPQPVDKSNHKDRGEKEGSGGVDLNSSFQDVSNLEKSAENLENWLENMIRMEGQLDGDAKSGGNNDASCVPKSVVPAAASNNNKQGSDSRESLSDEFFKKCVNSDKLPMPPLSSLAADDKTQPEDDDSITFGIRSKDINIKQRETFAAVANMKAKLSGMGILNSAIDDTAAADYDEQVKAELIHHFTPPLPPPSSSSAVKKPPSCISSSSSAASSSSSSARKSASAAVAEHESTAVFFDGINTMLLKELQSSSADADAVSSSVDAVVGFKVADLKMRTDKFKESLSEFARLQANITKSYEDLMQARNDLYSHSHSDSLNLSRGGNGPEVLSETVHDTDILLTNFKQSMTHFAHTFNYNHDVTAHSTVNLNSSNSSSQHSSPHKS